MIQLNNINDFEDVESSIYQFKNKKHSNQIYVYDIEVTSLFKIDGEYRSFDYTKPYNYYTDNAIEKRSCVYISMFGVGDNIYYFRRFDMIKEILEKIANPKIKKYVVVFNLAYEFQFLRMILSDYTIQDLLASAPRKPISFFIKELNIEFRCAYRLTGLSLARASEKFTNIRKATGDLYYNVARSPLSELSEKELYYCEYDIKCVTEIMRYFLKQYKSIARIPLTQTGEVRREIQGKIDYYYIKKMQGLVSRPTTRQREIEAFAGGLTHANFIYAGHIITPEQYGDFVYSADLDSAYPCQCLQKLPVGEWHEIAPDEIKFFSNGYYMLYVIELFDIESKYFNHYLSISKCLTYKEAYVDNGRVVKLKYAQLVITDIDLQLMIRNYGMTEKNYNILKVYASKKGYLDKRILNFILDLWNVKTSLKGIEEQHDYYMRCKALLNSIYGCMVTNIIKQNTFYKSNEWHTINATDLDFITVKLEEAKKSYSTLFPFSCGVFVTAKNRAVLFNNILNNDDKVVYYDTDSIKSIGKIDFTDFNKTVNTNLLEMCEYNGIDPQRLTAFDNKGRKHHIGIFEQEQESTAKEFVTLGAKKYAYRTLDNKLHLTVSGVKKASVNDLNDDIRNFKNGFTFGYNQTNEHDKGEHDNEKLTHYYLDEQEPFIFTDYQGNKFLCTDSFGIVLQPTIYTLGYTDLIEASEEIYLSDDYKALFKKNK